MENSSQNLQLCCTVGIIGLGAMGKVYAKLLSEAGWNVNACDLPQNFEVLKKFFAPYPRVSLLDNGNLVSRSSDFIIYSVEAANLESAVRAYASSTKVGAIVGGQTSCKVFEVEILEKYLPPDVDIVTCHSLHGPGVSPKGQPLVLIQHRASDESLRKVESILACFQSKYVFISANIHDRITADTQAVTHAAFLSMGAAFAANQNYPWEMPRYIGGIENVKVNVTLRIYANSWHVYAGLAILNPMAKQQIQQYAQSVTELFKLMLEGKADELRSRVYRAREAVFRNRPSSLLLDDKILDKFSLGDMPPERLKNTHLSLLAMVDCWCNLNIVPYDHMICSTPLFRLWLGITEYVFRNPTLLEECLDTAINDTTFRTDDIEFTFAARDWSQRVTLGLMDSYRDKFEEVQRYFTPRFPEATKLGNEMIKTILERTEQPACQPRQSNLCRHESPECVPEQV